MYNSFMYRVWVLSCGQREERKKDFIEDNTRGSMLRNPRQVYGPLFYPTVRIVPDQ